MTKAARANEVNTFRLDVRGAFLRRTDLSFANLERANLSGADFSHATLRSSDFKDANLDGTILKGADLTDAKNLTPSQLSRAILDKTTKLPENLSMANILAHRAQAGS